MDCRVPPTRYVVTNEPLYDSTLGPAGGITMHYTGTTIAHPWPSRKGEKIMDGKGIAKCVNGDVYEGSVSFGMYDGDGIMRYANGDVYEGQWKCGLRHGYGVLETHDGRSYVGLFADGEKHGLAEETAPGYHFVGIYRNGVPHGVGRVRLKCGDMYDGVYNDGRLHGNCTISYAHGDVFVGPFVEGVVHGEGTYTQVDSGDTYTECFEDGVCVQGVLDPGVTVVSGEGNFAPVGTPSLATASDSPISRIRSSLKLKAKEKICVVKYAATGDEYRGEWKRTAEGTNRRGVRHGYGTCRYHLTGNIYEGEWADDLREGFGTLKFNAVKQESASSEEAKQDTDLTHLTNNAAKENPTPVLYEGTFHLDKIDGRGVMYFSNGERVEGFWTLGKENGLSHRHPDPVKAIVPSQNAGSMFEMGHERDLDYHLRAAATPPAAAL